MIEQAKPYVPSPPTTPPSYWWTTRSAADRRSRLLNGELKHNVVALARAAKVLKIPTIVTTTARDSMWGPTFPELVEALPGIQIIDRSSVNVWDDAKVAAAIEATGRRKLIFAGTSLQVCAAFPAITAVGKGYDAYVVVDASGTFSQSMRDAACYACNRPG